MFLLVSSPSCCGAEGIVTTTVDSISSPEAITKPDTSRLVDAGDGVVRGKNELSSITSKTSAKRRTQLSRNDTGLSSSISGRQGRRRLPDDYGDLFSNVQESFDELFSTAPREWTAYQWFLFLLILFLALWCCGCLNGGRRYYRSGYYGGGNYGGGGGYYPYRYRNPSCCSSCCGGCLQDILLCFCCYELCCADCQHVPCCNPNLAGVDGGYVGHQMV